MNEGAATTTVGSVQSARELGREMLLEAGHLVARGWCHGTYARDETGQPVVPWDSRASAWSAMGAITRGWFLRRTPEVPRACDDPSMEAFLVAACALSSAVRAAPQTWNDRTALSAGEVLRALERATRDVELVSEGTLAEVREPIRRPGPSQSLGSRPISKSSRAKSSRGSDSASPTARKSTSGGA